MGLVTFDNIENGTSATANVWNERFGKLKDTLNGNVDTVNLKDGGVTREKIAAGAITSDKIDTDRYTDANGWQVNDLGTSKTYTRSVTVAGLNLGEGIRGEAANLPPPVGRTRDNIVISLTWYGGYSGHVLLGAEDSTPPNFTVQIAHNWPSPLTMGGTVHITAVEKL